MHEEFPAARILVELEKDNLLPAILFRTARKQCDADLNALARVNRVTLPDDAQRNIRKEIEKALARYTIPSEAITTHEHFDTLIRVGAGAHHAGQLLAWRLILEELMSAGVLRLLIATGTVAAGVDFPARSVIITAHSKRGSEGFNVLTSSEFQQMSGRAGRRGKDAVGLCIVAPGPFCDARIINEIAKKPPEPLRSAYYAAPATVLNLLKHRNVDDLRYTVERSLAAFLDRKSASVLLHEADAKLAEIPSDLTGEAKKKAEKRVRRLQRDAANLSGRQLDYLEKSLSGLATLGYVENGGLTDKGVWAAELCTSLVLELGEAIGDFIFSDLRLDELVGAVASIAGDPHRPYFNLKANPIDKQLFKQLEAILERVKSSYDNPFNQETAVIPDAALTVITWLEADSWLEFASLLKLANVAEGDVARLVTQTADHLNQISRLTESHPDLAAMAAEGRRRLLRPPLSDVLVNG